MTIFVISRLIVVVIILCFCHQGRARSGGAVFNGNQQKCRADLVVLAAPGSVGSVVLGYMKMNC